MTTYKIVKIDDNGKKISITTILAPVEYSCSTWTTPKSEYSNSKLFAFESLLDALKYNNILSHYSNHEIWECDCADIEQYDGRVPDSLNNHVHYTNFWTNGVCPAFSITVPEGTILCSAIKLTKKVDITPIVYYKRVRIIDGKLFSMYRSWYPNNAVEYVPNRWVVPKIPDSKLFVYNSLDDAMNGGEQEFDEEIWKCVIADKSTMDGVLHLWDVEKLSSSFWKNPNLHHGLGKMSIKNDGATLCSAVKLVEKVL
jgi:hypothetical protein